MRLRTLPRSDGSSPSGPCRRWTALRRRNPTTQSQAPLEDMARHVEESLAEHGVHVEVKDIKAGPRIVQFGLVPGWVGRKSVSGQSSDDDGGDGQTGARARVKVQSILSREKDLALALQTPYLRIEAPVPGEALVGIEVPSPTPSKVHLREVMESPPFVKIMSKGGLPVALGQDTGGAPVAMDLASLPHLLIAGATGSGKSVCINSIVASLLLTKPPDQLRLLMVDPKRVELTPFNKIPHLVAPVIVDADEVTSALRAMLREMNRRYKQLEEHGTRNISGYNSKSPEPMPYLVIIVDELADLMIAGGFEVEQSLVRLAPVGQGRGHPSGAGDPTPLGPGGDRATQGQHPVPGGLRRGFPGGLPGHTRYGWGGEADGARVTPCCSTPTRPSPGGYRAPWSMTKKSKRWFGSGGSRRVPHWKKSRWATTKKKVRAKNGALRTVSWKQARDVALRNPHISSGYMTRRFKIGEQRANQIMEVLEEEGLVIPGAR